MSTRLTLLLTAFSCSGCVAPASAPFSADSGGRSGTPASALQEAAGLAQHTDTRIGSDLEPDLSPDGRWLAFSSTRHEETPEIYLKPVQGNATIRKTFHPGVDCQPAFSPDGRRIAFCSNRQGDFDLYVMSTSGSEPPVALTQRGGDEMHPSWSPDGARIAYAAWDARTSDWELRVLDLATGTRSCLGVRGIHPAWSPDGRRLAFQRARERGERWYGIWTVDLVQIPGSAHVEASNPTEVVEDPAWGAVSPAWSRDARRLLFVSVRRESGKGRDESWRGEALWMTSLDGTGLVRLTEGPASASTPCWSSDERVYFVSDRSGSRCIWSLSPPGPAP